MSTTIRGAMPLGMVDSGPSRRLWADCPWDSLINGTLRGTAFHDDFENTPTLTTTAVTGKYASFADAGCTITQLLDQSFSAIQLLLDGNLVDDAVTIQSGGNTAGMARFLDPALANPHDVWFEARFALSSIAANTGSVFVGLMGEGSADATGDVIAAGGNVLADKDFIGFAVLGAAPSVLQFTYKRAGQTVQVPIATVNTMAAATPVSVGFHYMSSNPTARKITVYKNNVAFSTGVTAANIAAATFPDSDALALTCGLKSPATPVAKSLQMDWWRCATREN